MERLRAGAADVGVTEVGEARAERFAGRAGAAVDGREREVCSGSGFDVFDGSLGSMRREDDKRLRSLGFVRRVFVSCGGTGHGRESFTVTSTLSIP